MSAGNVKLNEGTQTALLVDTAGTVDVGVIKIDTSASGTYGSIWNGNVGVSSATITSIPNIPGGTLNAVTIVGGTVSVNELSGTINLGTAVLNDGTIDVVKNAGTIQGGSIIVTTGTVNTGTINTGTVNTGTINVATVTAGSIVVTAGTFVGNGGSIISYGPAAASAAAAGNPLNVGGTDSGGTIRTIKVDSGGLQRIGIDSGTISVLPNLPQGSINVTAGTIATLGTMGTLGLVNTVTTVSNITTGSIIQTAGTVNSGTVNVATITAGTINTGTINVGTVVGNVAAAAADSGNPVKIGGKYNATAPTLTDGNRGDIQLDVNGNEKVSLATLISGEDLTNNVLKTEQRFSYSAITTATTTTVKSGAGFLHLIVVTGGTYGTITAYDNTAGSGTIIFDMDATNDKKLYIFDTSFSTGLTIVTSAATKLTVSYR